MREGSHLPAPLGGKREKASSLEAVFRTKRTGSWSISGAFWMSYGYPASGDWILA
jgi:hypothetical protein